MEQQENAEILKQRIREAGEKVKQLMQPALQAISESVEELVLTGSRDEVLIEKTLNALQDLHLSGVGEREYLRLLIYYKSWNIDRARPYIDQYHQSNFLFAEEVPA
ncbi:MAG: hypothetical protein H7Y27_02850 [Gemmatimonadaceae bacterium]|nr:hypothetical protein [Chitinophagaceae bacterium]